MCVIAKTIGPMKEDREGDWGISSTCFLCGDGLRQAFNIPKTAKTLWLEATKARPSHNDAFRVRFNSEGYVRLDDRPSEEYYILCSMRNLLFEFGDDFYVTAYYE